MGGPPLGGLVGAFAVFAGRMFVNKVGAGTFAGLTITANILMSLVIDKYGWFGVDVHPLNGWRMLGGLLMVGGIFNKLLLITLSTLFMQLALS